jgi:hypothetical protein
MSDAARAARHERWRADIVRRFAECGDGVAFWRLVDTVRPYRDEMRRSSPDMDAECGKAAAAAFERLTGHPLRHPGKAA